MSKEIQRLTEDLVDYARLVIVAMFLIVIVYLIAQNLIGMVPATVGSIVVGLAFVYIYATNKTVRQAINSWAKDRK